MEKHAKPIATTTTGGASMARWLMRSCTAVATWSMRSRMVGAESVGEDGTSTMDHGSGAVHARGSKSMALIDEDPTSIVSTASLQFGAVLVLIALVVAKCACKAPVPGVCSCDARADVARGLSVATAWMTAKPSMYAARSTPVNVAHAWELPTRVRSVLCSRNHQQLWRALNAASPVFEI